MLVFAGVSMASVLVLFTIGVVGNSPMLYFIAGVITLLLGVAGLLYVSRFADRAQSTVARLKTLEEQSKRLVAAERSYEVLQAQSINTQRQLKILRNRVPSGFLDSVKQEIRDIRVENLALLKLAFESALQLKRDPRTILSDEQAQDLFRGYLANEDLVQLKPLIENFDVLPKQSLTTLRGLYRFYRASGYWDIASLVIEEIFAKTGSDSDAYVAERHRREIEVFAKPGQVTANLEDAHAYDPTGPILHMVGRVLPETQTGYTLRTQYTALAQSKKGLPVAIVGQSGITGREMLGIEDYDFQGITYYLLPGPMRNHVLLDEWLRHNIEQLALLVRKLRPSILHAQSDFFNALIVNVVGKKYGIPTVYESRGFWEYSWLSRTIANNDWEDSDMLFTTYGLPAAYQYRKHAEENARLHADHVFTLAEVMRDHILDSAAGKLASSAVTIVPNAVESTNFPVQEPDPQLAAQIGVPRGAITIGYISSMVEYEGIDTLIDAFKLVSELSSDTLALLLVGDGDYRSELEKRAEQAGVGNIYFTGRVPHEDVLRYYGLIDIFVVPRKPSTVADLVTPLKPFEAFSTGRAVIVSDVAALREIAEQSNAVEMFKAGDAEDLAGKIITLVNEPQRRKELSVRAARWVRHYRSWNVNVNEYYRIYKKLGYQGPDNLLIESELSLAERGINAGEILEALGNAELPALNGWFTIQNIKQSAASIIEDGWRFADFTPVRVSSIEEWASYGTVHRSWGFHLHAWEFMDPLLREYDKTGEIEWLDQALRIAVNWIQTHKGSTDPEDPMVWYDMSLSLRTPRLIALALRAARHNETREEAVILAASIGVHFEELHRDRAFNPNNNHGFYTAVSQVHAAKYASMFPQAEVAEGQGKERLTQMAVSQFAADGTHLEHSPDYHRMLLNSFEQAVQDNLIEDEEIKVRVQRAAHVYGWMVQPNGALVQFGDSPETQVVNTEAESIDPQTEYILSDGVRGDKPPNELAVFPEGGYAFVRSPQPERPGDLHKSSYLAFSAAFHSRAHKHADDLNVVWHDRGQPILCDGGRFGYGELLPKDSPMRREGFYYAAPERQYVEGTMAHNTLMIDGRDQERRTRTPYGSGIARCSESDGVFDLTGRVQHQDYAHRRRVIFEPGETLRLLDSVYSQSPEQREAIIWLNIAGHFEIERCGEDVVFISETEEQITRLRVEGPGRLIEPVKGQDAPLRGWRSRHDRVLEPTWSVGFTFTIETRASVETRLEFID